MTNEDDRVRAYMAAHPELVAKVAEEHGIEVVEEHPEDYYWLTDDLQPDPEEELGILVEEEGWLPVEEAMAEVMDELDLPEDYLDQAIDPSSSGTDKPGRFGKGSNAEGPDEVNL